MTHPKRIPGSFLAALTACAALTGLSSSALACGGDWGPAMLEYEQDHRPFAVSLAEQQLEDGKLVAAAASVIRSMPHVRTLSAKKSTVVARAQRTLAVALVRSGGALSLKGQVPVYARGKWEGKSQADRQANLEWAAGALRAVSATKADDPSVKTELAEALARLESHRQEARGILEELAKKDLIASPEGYAALAELRRAAGDEPGQRAAAERCRAMAGEGAGLCGAPASAKS